MMTVVRSPAFVVGVVVGFGLAAAELIGSGEAWRALLSGGIPLAYGTVLALVARRGDLTSVLAGRPVDERAAHVSEHASAWGFGLSAILVLAAVAWQIAVRGDWAPYAGIAAVMAVAYLGSLVVLQARH